MRSWRLWRFGLATFMVLCGITGPVFAQGLRGSGEVIQAITPTETSGLESLLHVIRPEGSFDPDAVQQMAETREVRSSVVELAAEVLRHFPPSEFDYVSLGRSPAPVAIAMEEILRARGATAEIRELPLSGLRHDDFMFEAEWYRKTLRTHFEKYFFNGVSPTGRKVLVLDYVQKGGTLNTFASIVAMGEKEGWIQRETHILGLLNPQVDPRSLWLTVYSKNRDSFPQSRWHSMMLPHTMWPYFYYNSFKHLALYEGFAFRNREYEESVKTHRWGTGMPGRNRNRNEDRRELPEPTAPDVKRTERRSIFAFWNRGRTERGAYAEHMQRFLTPELVQGSAIKVCGRVHRLD